MPDDKKGPAADHQHRKKIASDSPADVWPGGRQRRSAFVLWGPGGIGPLLSRLRREYQGDNDLGNPLTGDELAGLLDHFKDEPIPSALRVILQHELRGKRKRKPGPKPVRTAVEYIADTLFPGDYAEGIVYRREASHLAKATSEEATSQRQALQHPDGTAVRLPLCP